MSGEKGTQIPFGDMGMEFVTDLDTGKQTLRPKSKRARSFSGGQTKAPAPTRRWWEIVGLDAFNNAAEGWKQGQSVLFAERFGYNVESADPQMNKAETDELLKKAFKVARRLRITSLDVVGAIKAESLSLEVKLGANGN